MGNHARTMGASFIILSLIVGPAASTAAEDPASERPAAQAQPDDKSYLPPWMRQGGGENSNAPGNSAAAPVQPSAAVDDGAAKKAKVASEAQRPRRRGASGDVLFGGFGALFGR